MFGDPETFGGKTFEIAGDQLTGQDLEVLFSQAAWRPIAYSRFSDDVDLVAMRSQKRSAPRATGPTTALEDAQPCQHYCANSSAAQL